jgi:hypothetical protein
LSETTAQSAIWTPYAGQPAITLTGDEAQALWSWVVTSPAIPVEGEPPGGNALGQEIRFTLSDGSNKVVTTQSTGVGDRGAPLASPVFVAVDGAVGALSNTWPKSWIEKRTRGDGTLPLWLPPNVVLINDPTWLLDFNDIPLANAALHALRDKTDIPFDFGTHGPIVKTDWLARREAWLTQLKSAGIVP